MEAERDRLAEAQQKATEVLVSLDHPTREDLEDELSDLNLLDYCRPYLKRRDKPA